jgi:shikimate kinase
VNDVRDAHLVIVGLMGSGKTTLGTRLAARLGREFLDNDVLLEARTRSDAAQLRREHGEAALHGLESDVLIDALASRPFAVIAAAASTIDRADVRTALRDHAFVVWLEASVDELTERLRDPGRRPLPRDPRSTLRHQVEARSARFASVADVVIDTTDRDPQTVLDEVMARLT